MYSMNTIHERELFGSKSCLVQKFRHTDQKKMRTHASLPEIFESTRLGGVKSEKIASNR